MTIIDIGLLWTFTNKARNTGRMVKSTSMHNSSSIILSQDSRGSFHTRVTETTMSKFRSQGNRGKQCHKSRVRQIMQRRDRVRQDWRRSNQRKNKITIQERKAMHDCCYDFELYAVLSLYSHSVLSKIL
jgi:transcriptional regulator with GAF, ATPase, and Fis domain